VTTLDDLFLFWATFEGPKSGKFNGQEFFGPLRQNFGDFA